MKTIQIPTTSNPFIVNINNNDYQYRAGDTIEVPDEVAAAIEDALALEPKPMVYLSKFAERIGGSITEIPTSCFDGVRAIASYALADCDGITNITIPNGVNSIGPSAFNSCSNLESVVMGNSITNIAYSAFDWCQKLAMVYLPEIPPSLENVNAFKNINSACTFYCKTQASLDAYRAAPNWSTLAGTYAFVVEA